MRELGLQKKIACSDQPEVRLIKRFFNQIK